MRKFNIEFAGSCVIEAEDEDVAVDKFWDGIRKPTSECTEWSYSDTTYSEPNGYTSELFIDEDTPIWKERVAEKDLETMMECIFPGQGGWYRSLTCLGIGRIKQTEYDAWDFLHAKMAMMTYSGPYRTI